jgi:hypothetical protein
VFRRTSSVAVDSPANIASHVPDAGGGSRPVATGLWQRHILHGRPTCLYAAYLVRRLQSVLNASARMIFQLRHSDHITDSLASLHWLRVPERIQYKIAVLAYKVLQGTAPRYLGPLVRVSDLPGRRSLRCASTDRLAVPSFKLSTIGSRSVKVAAALTWNSLPEDVTSSPTLRIF